ncbi:unnamed protein product, partial [Prorocentrum cordatum]
FYDSSRIDAPIPAALGMDFSPGTLLMLLLQHSSARFVRWGRSCSEPQCADRSILAGSHYSNNIARAAVRAVLGYAMGEASGVPCPLARAWFYDISIRIMRSESGVKRQLVVTAKALQDGLESHGLKLADRSVIFSTSFRTARQLQLALRRPGVEVKAVADGGDFGGDRGPVASLMYGAVTHGLAPTAMKAARRRRAQALRRAWPGRCLTGSLALEGEGPAISIARRQLRAWFNLRDKSADQRPLIRKAWAKVYFRLQAQPE